MGLHFRRATGVYAKTFPFVLLRLGIGVLLGVLAIVYFGAALWIGSTLLDSGVISGWIAAVGLLVAGGLFLVGWRLVSRYVLYLVKAGHIAVITHVVDTGEVPSNQITFGIQRVKSNFGSASALFVVDRLVTGVVKQFNDAVLSVSDLLGFVPSLQRLVRLLTKAIAIAASYIDEAILAYLFLEPDRNRWTTAREGIVLYGKTWKPVLASTVLIVAGGYFAAFALLLAVSPLAGVLGSLSPTFETLGWVVVAGTVGAVYVGVLNPWVKTVVITTFLVEARGTTPDASTADWIASRSDRFEELTQKAEGAIDDENDRGRPAPEQNPPVISR